MNRLAEKLTTPLSIKDKPLTNRLLLAPMTYLGNIAHRQLLSDYGGYGLLFAEMCGAKTLPVENREVSAFFKWRDEEAHETLFQIFGNNPHTMAQAAKRIEQEGFWGVDLNFGCSVSQIHRQGCGAALLKTPDQCIEIIKAVRDAIDIPLWVKFRTGWHDSPNLPVRLAQAFEQNGVNALTYHPRTAPDRRSRPPKWTYIRQVKEAVTIPVFGNGNVFTKEDCLKMLEETNCDGVALGRIAIARPWVFSEWTGRRKWTEEEKRHTAFILADYLSAHYPEALTVRRYKRFLAYFTANFQFGHTLHMRIKHTETMVEIKEALTRFYESEPRIMPLPNQSVFQ